MVTVVAWVLAIFIAGIVTEYHFGLYEKSARAVAALVTPLVLWLRSLLRWLRLTFWTRHLGSVVLAAILALLMVILIVALWMLLRESFIPPIPYMPSKAIAADWSFWTWLVGIVAALVAFIVALASAVMGAIWWVIKAIVAMSAWLGKMFGVLLLGLMALLPSCNNSPETISTPLAIATAVVQQDEIVFRPRSGDGCIRITRHGGQPLSLEECIALTKSMNLEPVTNERGFLEAPRVFPTDEFVLQKDGWTLVRK